MMPLESDWQSKTRDITADFVLKDMGGYAHIINGRMRGEALSSIAPNKGFFSRLFGGSRKNRIRRFSMGDAVMIDVPCLGLSERIHEDFTNYLKLRIPNPDEATQAVIGYLEIAGAEVHIRGEERHSSCYWYTQVSFPGCAGAANVSAEVCAHWAAAWTDERLQDFIEPLLGEYGFQVIGQGTESQTDSFFILVNAMGRNSYASVASDGGLGVDGSIYEELTEDPDEFEDRMRCQYRDKISLGQCECQLCRQGSARSGNVVRHFTE